MKKNLQILTFLFLFSFIGYGPVFSDTVVVGNDKETIAFTDIMQQKADELIKTADPVQIRRNIKVISNLVDRLIEEDKKEDALPYLEILLQHNAWALQYQMLYAELMYEKEETEIAYDKAELVEKYAQTDTLIDQARTMLGKELLEKIPPLEPINSQEYAIVLLPIGVVDTWLLFDLADELEKSLGLRVYVQECSVDIPPYARSPLHEFLSHISDDLIKNIKTDQGMRKVLGGCNIYEEDLKDPEKVVEAYRILLLNYEGPESLLEFNIFLEDMQLKEDQWEISDLLESLKKEVLSEIGVLNWNKHIKYLGITQLDAFSGESNYIFGTAENNGNFGVVTYHRFRTDFNNEVPDRDKVKERTLKQCLSSLGFMFGLTRCTTPTCARAYPHNLAEHDGKSKELCSVCLKKLEEQLAY